MMKRMSIESLPAIHLTEDYQPEYIQVENIQGEREAHSKSKFSNEEKNDG